MLARPGLPEFEYIKAETFQDVFDYMKENGDDLKLLMGGTDLFIQMRDHRIVFRNVATNLILLARKLRQQLVALEHFSIVEGMLGHEVRGQLACLR